MRADENALWSLGPHDISVINYLTGEEPLEVSARGECYLQAGVEDVVFGYIKFPSGVIGHLHESWLDPHKSRKITVVGSEKMVVFDDMETDRKVTVYDKGAVVPEYQSYGEYVSLRFGDIHIPRIANDEPLRLECEHFVECVREGKQPVSDGQDGLNVVRVLEAMQRSLRDGGEPVKIAELGKPAAARRALAVPTPSDRGHNLLLGDGVVIGDDVTFGANVVVHDDTVIGDGCFIQDGVVLGKVPSLSPRSTAKRGQLEPLRLGDGLRRVHERRRLSRHDAWARAASSATSPACASAACWASRWWSGAARASRWRRRSATSPRSSRTATSPPTW